MKKQIFKIYVFLKELFYKSISYSKKKYIFKKTKITLFDFLNFFWTGIINESISIRASSLAFKLFLSLFPAMIFLVTLLPYISTGSFQEALMQTLESIMPDYSYKAFESTISDILYNPKFVFLSTVFILSIVYSVSNMNSILNTFNKSYYLQDKRSFFKKIVISLWLTLLFFLIIILALFFISINQSLIEWVYANTNLGSFVNLSFLNYGRWVVLFFMMLTWLSVLYTIGPPVKIKFRYFSPGSLFSSFFFIALSIGFNFFVGYFANVNKIYGVLGVILVFFIWLYYNSLIIIIGFEINASLFIAPNKKPEI